MRSLFSDSTDSSDERFRGWLLYDRDCAFCSRWARSLEPILLARGFHVAALQDDWVSSALGISQAELLRALRLWTPEGKTYLGADAVMQLARFIFWAKPITWLSGIPGAMRMLRALYARIAARRHCLQVCPTFSVSHR
ncbi:MAG TPA: DCC1-like thiol-disulfide oxidoreductase family protein [Candidatus Nitrosotenuis sp.]|nr:DCC1-like thiol-disulfide oxidoreductase family protein [Candidatus Nitrosotenuis sp.]